MKTTFKVKEPNSVEITLEATMTIGEWRKVVDALKNGYKLYHGAPYDFRNSIEAAYDEVTKTFENPLEDE